MHRPSETCGKSLIEEAEGEINDILHEINEKEQKNVKDSNSDPPEKKQANEYSQQSNTELKSDKPGVISIQEMALSLGENEHDVIEEETDIDVTQLDEYSGKVSNEQTNIIEEYLLNENVIHNIEEKTELLFSVFDRTWPSSYVLFDKNSRNDSTNTSNKYFW